MGNLITADSCVSYGLNSCQLPTAESVYYSDAHMSVGRGSPVWQDRSACHGLNQQFTDTVVFNKHIFVGCFQNLFVLKFVFKSFQILAISFYILSSTPSSNVCINILWCHEHHARSFLIKATGSGTAAMITYSLTTNKCCSNANHVNCPKSEFKLHHLKSTYVEACVWVRKGIHFIKP